MKRVKGFVAYPGIPAEIGGTIEAALQILRRERGYDGLISWKENDIAGRFVVEPILSEIDNSQILLADITRLNFNVTYEIGYAIGRKKRLVLVRNSALKSDDGLVRETGIYDTLGYLEYENSRQLSELIEAIPDTKPLQFDQRTINTTAPVYILLPTTKTDVELRIISKTKKARWPFRTFDPEELGRLSAREAIENVACSAGVIVNLLSATYNHANVHNLRAAFVAGLACGMEKNLVILQSGDDPVPIDYRDFVAHFSTIESLDTRLNDFWPLVTEASHSGSVLRTAEPASFLARITLGASAAENELSDLEKYYLETDEYRRALRGEVQVIVGRKGSGKTALFARLRDKLRGARGNVVLDLKPEGFQLRKFSDLVLDLLAGGTKEHALTAFWEYLLLLETCHRILEVDRFIHLRDNTLYDLYHSLENTYKEDAFLSEGDFAERLQRLTKRIGEDLEKAMSVGGGGQNLSEPELTELLYRHNVPSLRRAVHDYLKRKQGLWILFDNLDKGWATHGLGPTDVTILRCLLEAIAKMQRALQRQETECRGIVFLRNDVYELLVEQTSDRGKVSRVVIDWTDPDLLREMIRRRMVVSCVSGAHEFREIWQRIAISHIEGEESSQYLIERSLMRPRGLIELIQYCKSRAVNLGHERMEVDDILHGEGSYSNDLLSNIGLEMRDVFPKAEDILYEFIGLGRRLTDEEVNAILRGTGLEKDECEQVLDLLLWYGFLGVESSEEEAVYIYSVKYDLKKLKATIRNASGCARRFWINPAFWVALEIK